MAGLLDFNDPQTRFGMGLLALGQMPREQGMQGLMGLLAQQDKSALAKSEADWNNEKITQQRNEWQSKEKATRAAEAQKAAIPSLFGAGQGGGVGGFNVQQALALGLSPEQIKQYADVQNVGRAEVARTVEGMDSQGRPVLNQFDKFGGTVGDAVPQWKAPVVINQGSHQTLFDPGQRQALGSLPINMSASERDASARGWAGHSVARERLAMDQQNAGNSAFTFNTELGGYVPKAPGGNFIPLEGANKNPKLTESEAKNSLYLGQMREASSVLNGKDGKDASPAGVAMTGSPYTNWAASDRSQVAGQAQRQWAEAYLRAKTGAAATAGEVENNIRTYFPVLGDDDKAIARKANARIAAEQDMTLPAGRGAGRIREGGASGGWGEPVPKTPMKNQIVGGFRFKGGNPADQSNWEQAR